MGDCFSTLTNTLTSRSPVLSANLIDGDEKDYHDRFIEDRILGAGEFGEVKLVHEMKAVNSTSAGADGQPQQDQPLACKVLRKGLTFKDNTLYSPLKRDVLRGECQILRTLAGQHYCLELHSLYESPSLIYVVTEFCAGGEMMEYLVNYQKSLRTEDVSRIAYQLLDAVDHCHKHNVIHRDIKPENVMFKHASENSPLRLIDFGSGTIDSSVDDDESSSSPPAAVEQQQPPASPTTVTATNADADGGEKEPLVRDDAVETAVSESMMSTASSSPPANASGLIEHTTFAGSAFYISPEMFMKTYTCRTDLWSVGVALYVLVAGYPADELQKAFNILQTSKNRDLRSLPNLPEDMPDSFFDMLEDLLRYRHKSRKSASEMLSCEFVQFHKVLAEGGGGGHDGATGEDEEIPLEDIAKRAEDQDSELLDMSVSNRSKFSRTKSVQIDSVHKHTLYMEYQKFQRSVTTLLATILKREDYDVLLMKIEEKLKHDGQKNVNLGVLKISELLKILNALKYERILEMIGKLPNASKYGSFAFHVAPLREFARRSPGGGGGGDGDELNGSTKSDGPITGRALSVAAGNSGSSQQSNKSGGGRHSVHGGNVFENFTHRKQSFKKSASAFRLGGGKKDNLNGSSHL